jgi:dTDP-4-amino-4,6-dideoxygalactose transaminase
LGEQEFIKLIEPEMPNLADFSQYLNLSYEEKRFSNFGPNATELELEIGRYLANGRRACLVSNCTVGLSACLMALDIRGKVVLPAFTFMATAAAVINAGCIPIAVDCDVDTLEMCNKKLEHELINNDIRAIIHVRSFGFCRDLSETEKLANHFDIPLIIDSAAAFGGMINENKKVGYAGTAEVFSFHATKPMAVGEGGVVLSNIGLINKIKSIINFNFDSIDTFSFWGMNGKMSEFHAAIGRAALNKLPDVILGRQKVASLWMDELSCLDKFIDLPKSVGYPSWQVFPILLKKPLAHRVQANLYEQHRFQTRVYYYPTINCNLFSASKTPQSKSLSMSTLCLPVNRSFTKGTIVDCVQRLEKSIDAVF